MPKSNATIYDIAKFTGLAPSTVSKVLNNYKGISEKTREKVMDSVEKLNYIPNLNARILMTKKSYMVGVLLKEDRDLAMEHPHFNVILEGFRSEMEKNGYDIVFLGNRLGSRSVTYTEHCLHRGLDGVMIAIGGKDVGDRLQVKELIGSNIPKVSVEGIYPNTCTVISDNKNSSIKALNYLHFIGHRNIGIVKLNTDSVASNQRFAGYLEFLKSHNQELNQDYIIEIDTYTYQSGLEAAKKITNLGKYKMPTAVFCIYDEIAKGFIDGLKMYNINVPEDISVVGFDDITLARFMDLTTVRQNRRLIGKTAAIELLRQIENPEEILKEKIISLETDLIIRKSCKKYNSQGD